MEFDPSILLVEDNEDDIFFMKRALQEAGIRNPLHVVEDGQEAVDFLTAAGRFSDGASHPIPSLILLDLKLPLKSGHEVLDWTRRQKPFESIIIIVLTSSEAPADISLAYKLGANSYLVKPPTADQLLGLARAFKLYWLGYNKFGGVTHCPANFGS